MSQLDLIAKYDVPAPRYTSYPTVPYWNDLPPTEEEWKSRVKDTFTATNASEGISLYIHLPFCERLCTYCGCNKRITINHAVEDPYIEDVLREWKLYLELFDAKPRIRELHLGGGTPTFFTPENLRKLIDGIHDGAEMCEDASYSFEAHPTVTSVEHLQMLYDLGFRRASFGIQDFDPKIQRVINRQQSYGQVYKLTEAAREIGYTSINYDIIFGLPLQTKHSIADTLKKIDFLKPDRIAFYSYAHVPWVSPSQRAYTEDDLPKGADKRALYEMGREMLEESGYHELGLDHFALASDSLYEAARDNKLHRNFMGYTDQHTDLMIGLGVSSISDSWTGFIQNEKKLEDWRERVRNGEFPIFRGHLLSEEDLIIRRHILDLMCHLETNWERSEQQCDALTVGLTRMKEFEQDGLIHLHPYSIEILPKGRPFIRNICLALDSYHWKKKPETRLFSQSV